MDNWLLALFKIALCVGAVSVIFGFTAALSGITQLAVALGWTFALSAAVVVCMAIWVMDA